MSSNKTQNYNLHAWEPSDDFLRSEFNDNFATLDATLKGLRDDLDAEAATRAAAESGDTAAWKKALSDETAAREAADSSDTAAWKKALSDETAARQKADSDDTAAWKKAVNAEQTSRSAAINSILSTKAELVFGTYEGDDQLDRTIVLGFQPKAVLLFDEYGRACTTPYGNKQVHGGLFLPGHPLMKSAEDSAAAEIVANGFALHDASNTQVNKSPYTYIYIAVK